MSIIQGTSKSSAASYTIDQSIRFSDNDSARLERTVSSSGSLTAWTLSCWIKRGRYTVNVNSQWFPVFSASNGATTYDAPLNFNDVSTGGAFNVSIAGYNWRTSALARDTSSWYHCVVVWDSNNGTTSDRMRLYINGERVTDFSTSASPSSGANSRWNSSSYSAHRIGNLRYSGAETTYLFDGYLSEIYFIDGIAVTDASDFGEVNADTGQWVPIAYTGSMTGNSFYITGADSADLGADYSGNGNNFTSSGLTSVDQRTDTPTNNHCTFNPLWIDTYTLSDGNLVTSTGADASALGTMAVDATDSDGWYWEMKVTTAATYPGVGIILASQTSQIGAVTNLSNTSTNRYYYEGWSGNFNNQGSAGAYGNTWSGTANKVIGVYLKGGALWFSIDGVVQNSGDPSTASTGAAITGLTGDFYPVVVYAAGSGTQAAWTAQFAKADWGTTPPAGYKAINTASLPDPTIANPYNHFNTVLYEGNGGGQRVGQFQPITESYNVDYSCMFDDASPDWMNRTNGTPDDNDVWTLSFWVKFAEWGSDFVLQGYTDGNNNEGLSLNGTGGTLAYKFQIGGVDYGRFESAEIFKDPSRWYHIHITRNAGTYTFKADGVDLTDTDSGGSAVTTQNAFFNTSGTALYIGAANGGVASTGLNGYLAEMHFIDGSVVAYTNFGQLDASTNRWIPKEYTSGWGSNGWYLDFSNSSSLGADSSGNGNNFSVNNIVAANQVTDSPTKNFCTLDPLIVPTTMTFTDGNLALSGYTAVTSAYGTFGMSSGKWYWELVAQANAMAGVAATPNGSQYPGQAADSYAFDLTNGTKYNNGSSSAFGAGAVSAGDTVGVAFDADNGDLKFYDNSGTLIGTAFSGLTSGPYFPVFRNGSAANISVNFGQKTFSHSLPTGHVELNNDNLPLTGAGLSGFVWIKNRDAIDNHMLFDAVRGATKDIHSNATNAEVTNVNTLQRFLLNGFEIGNDVEVNTSGESYVAWQWLYNSLTASSNTDGSITSTVSVNTTAGFSICKFNPGGNVNITFGHGLGQAPRLVIVKNLVDGATNWQVLHLDQGVGNKIWLNKDNGVTADANMWQSTAPTSTVVSVGTTQTTNEENIAYCFAEVEGFSKFGKYTGNGSADGPFVYCGFRPAFFMIKRSDSTGSWLMLDNKRIGYNVDNNNLRADTTTIEQTDDWLDFVSNGVKIRSAATTWLNASGGTYLIAAFAESPFKTANAR